MSFLNTNNKKDNLTLIFDIGSSSVGGVVFEHDTTSGLPKIIFAVREPLDFNEEINIDQFLALTLSALEVIVSKVYLAGLGAPNKIFCILSSPWYVSQTRVINVKKENPFVFTSKFADDLTQNEINIFVDEHLAQYSNTEHAIRLLELRNIKVMLNGYEVADPLNQKAKEVEMTVFISMSPEKILGKIEEVISRYFHFKQIIFSSFVMTFFSVIRDLYSHKDGFLLVDIGGEVTDVSMIKKNILRESISFPSGRNFLIRGIAIQANCSFNEAKSYISLLKDDHADDQIIKKLSPAINKIKKEWLKKFQDSLSNLSNDISIPSTIYVATDRDFMEFFCQSIKDEQFNQYTLTESKFEVIALNNQMLQGLASFKEEVIRDPFLIIDSIYINRFFN